ncbi:MAG: transcription antitermination factor NusB [Treponema sp.]|jgi:N utilization substance protein B|nr:transcription antitermination factor NusB [Treponema sp.]
MASRRKGRILAFQALYAWESRRAIESQGIQMQTQTYSQIPASVPLEEFLDFSWLEVEKLAAMDEATLGFSRLLITGTIENLKGIDAMIKNHLENWDLSRLNRVDLAILRMSVYALMFQDMAPSIIINEAIGISREFGTDESYRFINGVLDSIRKTLGAEKP